MKVKKVIYVPSRIAEKRNRNPIALEIMEAITCKEKTQKSTIAVYLSSKNQVWLKKAAALRGTSVSELVDKIITELRE